MKEGVAEASITGNYANFIPRNLNDEDLAFPMLWTNSIFPKEELGEKIMKIQDEIRNQHHVYRCISEFSHLRPKSVKHSMYSKCIQDLKEDNSKTILDLGTCFGQEVRTLIVDGVDPNQIFATDVSSTYWDAGKSIYFDENPELLNRGLNLVHTVWGDWAQPFTNDDTPDISDHFLNSFDYVMCWSVFHVLSKDQSEAMIKRIFKILKPNGILFGATNGAKIAQEWHRTPDNSAQRFLHDIHTLMKACHDAGFEREKIQVLPIDASLIFDRLRQQEQRRQEEHKEQREEKEPTSDHRLKLNWKPLEDNDVRRNMIRLGFTIQK